MDEARSDASLVSFSACAQRVAELLDEPLIEEREQVDDAEWLAKRRVDVLLVRELAVEDERDDAAGGRHSAASIRHECGDVADEVRIEQQHVRREQLGAVSGS